MNRKKPEMKKCMSCPDDNCMKPKKDFYLSKNPEHLDGLVPWCKSCVQNAMVAPDGRIDLDKTISLLKQLDRPFYKDVMQQSVNQLIKVHQDIPSGMVRYCGKEIIGIYFKNINMKHNLYMRFSDSEKSGYMRNPDNETPCFDNEPDFFVGGELNDIILNSKATYTPPKQTQEGLIYDPVWRGDYTPSDIAYLNDYYKGLERDYKLVTENHRDYARKIAKASLQMDLAFNEMLKGVKGAETKYKNAREAFDTLSKSAKFSESTRSVNDVGISSFSKVASIVESHNWIPEHKPIEKDQIDELIDYLSTILKSV